MQIRSLMLVGLALANLAGCQSYFPNGYSNAGPYSAFPPGGYGPPPGSAGPPSTYQQGRTLPPGRITTDNPPLNNNRPPSRGQNNVPQPREPGSLGAPDNEDDQTIRRGTGAREIPPSRLNGLDESEEIKDSLGSEGFLSPKQLNRSNDIEETAAIDDADELPLVTQRPAPSRPIPNPYYFDKQGYALMQGKVMRDPQGGGWRLRYTENPTQDTYGGSLLLVGNEDEIDTLMDDDTIRVRGRIDPSAKDSRGKPVYRVDQLEFVKPKPK
jgi:hypothetical protein